MLSNIRRLIGSISVKEDEHLIHIDGLPANVIAHDIGKIWKTSRIGNYMFTSYSRSSISFNKWFAPDVLYTLQEVVKRTKRQYNYRAIEQIVSLMYENTWLKNTLVAQDGRLDFNALKKMRRKPLSHQLAFFEEYQTNVGAYGLNGYWLGSPPGSGKTYMALAMYHMTKAKTMVAVVPKTSLHTAWEDGIEKEFEKTPSYWLSDAGDDPVVGKDIYVFHYERLDDALAFVKKNKSSLGKITIALDESHNFNELSSLRTNLFIELCRVSKSNDIIWMSGTPLKAAGAECIPFLLCVDPKFNEDAMERFKSIFGKNAERAYDVLAHRLGTLLYEVDKRDIVMNDIEPTKTKLVKIPNGDIYTLDAVAQDMKNFISQRLAYYQSNMKDYVDFYTMCVNLHMSHLRSGAEVMSCNAYKEEVAIIRRGYDPATMKELVKRCNKYELEVIIPSLPKQYKEPFKEARTVVKYYELKVQGEALGRVLGKKRTECHVKMVPHAGLETMIDTGRKKTIIFTSFVEVVNTTYDYLVEKGYKPLKVNGDNSKDLMKIIQQFKNDIDANPLITTFQFLSAATPLTMASNTIFMNQPYRDYWIEQAKARTDRLDQDGSLTYWDVYLDTNGKPNLSTRNKDILIWSRMQVAAMTGKPVIVDEAEVVAIATESWTDSIMAMESRSLLTNEVKPHWAAW